MRTMRSMFTVLIVAGVPTAYLLAQQPAAQPQPMTFFVTSVGKGDGANLGGLAGADAHCQALATAAGRGGAEWRAYLSTQGANAVSARDRIGTGPWRNFRGQVISNDTRHPARRHHRAGAHRQPARETAVADREGRTGERRR